jgi:RNA polymerase sigma-70 factor (ECF subfamily)
LFHVAAENIKPEFRPATWSAFWRTAVENAEAVAVAGELGMSVGAIYIAKSRVLARLREETKRLDVESA